jgi:cytochrome c oxidase subunit 4
MNGEALHDTHPGGSRLYVWIWVYLLVITGVEILLAYVQVFPPEGMLAILMLLSLVKAALIVTYFMHMRYERMSFVLSLVPAVVLVIALLFVFFPDSFRLYELRVR